MYILYQIFLLIILLFSPIIIFLRILKNKEHKKRFLEKFSFYSQKRKLGKLIWFHGASVGEIMSIIPLIEKYEKDKKINQILITSSTLSSTKIINKFKFKKTIHQFYPVDIFFINSRFLNFWKPNVAFFIESEIWPSMFKEIKKKKIPLILLNARLTEKSFKKWIKLKEFAKSIFNLISISYPQNLETANFLKKLGVRNIKYLGNLKFSENYDEKKDVLKIKLKKQFSNKKIWIASSTHQNEEVICAKAHIELKRKIDNLLTIIIPRHVHRANEIIPEINKLKLNVVRHSQKIKNLNNIDIYLVDTFGETKKFYKIGGTVFLGGSLINRGGQNPLEAARYGNEILHGPNIQNFKDVYKLLKSLNFSKKIKNYNELVSLIRFKKNRKISVKIRNIGKKILKNTVKELDFQIKNEFKKT